MKYAHLSACCIMLTLCGAGRADYNDLLQEAADYNIFVLENATHIGGDVEGALAAGSNLTLQAFNAAYAMWPNGNAQGIGILVGGDLNATNGQCSGGNIHVGGTASLSSWGIPNGSLINPSNPLNWVHAKAWLNDLSAYWSTLPTTTSAIIDLQPWGGLTLTGVETDLNVFNLTEAQWKATGQVNLIVPDQSTVVINVGGAGDVIPSNHPWFGSMFWKGDAGDGAKPNWSKTIWNFYEATSLSQSSVSWRGSILAPKADFTYSNGHVDGHLIVKSLTMTTWSAEAHWYPFTGNPPLPYDFGCAPGAYPTYATVEGAYHINNGIDFLGEKIYANDGLTMPLGSAPDDDGVFFGSLVRGQNAGVTVMTTTAGFLSAWIDFNGNGDWSDAGEKVFANVALVAGENHLSVFVPTYSVTGKTVWSRFRFSKDNLEGVSFTGLAGIGEVEDYPIDFENPIAVELISFEARTAAHGMLLSWQTAEAGIAGFNILRAASAEAAFQQVNGALIADGRRENDRVSYSFLDRSAGSNDWYRLETVDLDGSRSLSAPIRAGLSTRVTTTLPNEFALEQNFPNPFNPSTTITFSLPHAAEMSLEIFDMQGKLIRTLFVGSVDAGRHSITWDGLNLDGLTVANGVYLYRLRSQELTLSRKMLMIK